MLPFNATLVIKLRLLAHCHFGELAGMLDLALMHQHNGLLNTGWRVAWSQFQGLVQILQSKVQFATLALKCTQCTCRKPTPITIRNPFSHTKQDRHEVRSIAQAHRKHSCAENTTKCLDSEQLTTVKAGSSVDGRTDQTTLASGTLV